MTVCILVLAAPAPTMGQTGEQGRHYSGTISGKYHIEMFLERQGDKLQGKYYYKRFGKFLRLEGRVRQDGDFVLWEYTESGRNTGVFRGDYHPDLLKGTWSRPSGQSRRSFTATTRAKAPGRNTKERGADRTRERLLEASRDNGARAGRSPREVRERLDEILDILEQRRTPARQSGFGDVRVGYRRYQVVYRRTLPVSGEHFAVYYSYPELSGMENRMLQAEWNRRFRRMVEFDAEKLENTNSLLALKPVQGKAEEIEVGVPYKVCDSFSLLVHYVNKFLISYEYAQYHECGQEKKYVHDLTTLDFITTEPVPLGNVFEDGIKDRLQEIMDKHLGRMAVMDLADPDKEGRDVDQVRQAWNREIDGYETTEDLGVTTSGLVLQMSPGEYGLGPDYEDMMRLEVAFEQIAGFISPDGFLSEMASPR